jgi:hypothetical protein
MYIISQSIRIKCPVRGFSTLTKWNLVEFGGLSRIWQNLADITDIADIVDIADIADIIDIVDIANIANITDIADIIVGTDPYIPLPPSYIIAKYLKKNPLSLL